MAMFALIASGWKRGFPARKSLFGKDWPAGRAPVRKPRPSTPKATNADAVVRRTTG